MVWKILVYVDTIAIKIKEKLVKSGNQCWLQYWLKIEDKRLLLTIKKRVVYFVMLNLPNDAIISIPKLEVAMNICNLSSCFVAK